MWMRTALEGSIMLSWIISLAVLTPHSAKCESSDVFYGYLGRSATLQCPVSNSIKEMRWYFKNGIFKILHTINTSGTFPSSDRYEANITSATLTIHNIDLSDAALYKCTVSDGRTLKGDHVLLKIADSHRNDFPLKVVQGFVGHNNRIPCPVPLSSNVQQLSWYAETNMIYGISELGHTSLSREKYSADRDTGVLIVTNATEHDALTYKCRIITGRHVREFKVKLTFEQNIEYAVYGSKGQSITLTCPAHLALNQTSKISWMKKTADHANPILIAVWTKNNRRPLVRKRRKYSIDISTGALKLTPFTNEAVFLCEKYPMQHLNRPPELASVHAIDVNIQRGKLKFMQPSFVSSDNIKQQQILTNASLLRPGYVIMLQVCAEEFMLPTEVHWFRNGKRLRSNCQSKIEIPTSKCQGATSRLTYNVTAHNNGDNITAAVFGPHDNLWKKSGIGFPLRVIRSADSPKVTITPGKIVAQLYLSLPMKCTVTGYDMEPPTNFIIWSEFANNDVLEAKTHLHEVTEDGMDILSSEIIYNVTMRATFQKFCCAFMDYSACSFVEVKYPPETTVVRYYEDDRTLTLECLVHSHPEYSKIEWWHNSHKIYGEGTLLEVVKSSLSTSDIYTCTADNGIKGAALRNEVIHQTCLVQEPDCGVCIFLIMMMAVIALAGAVTTCVLSIRSK